MAALSDLVSKVDQGEPLEAADVETLSATPDILSLGMMATAVRRRLHGRSATFLRVADVSVADAGTAGRWWDPADPPGEVRLVGVPRSLEEALSAVDRVRAFAADVVVSAFDLADVESLGETLPAALQALRQRGLEQIASASLDRLARPERSLAAAADAGLAVSRLTMAGTPPEDWAAICARVSELQGRLATIRAFAPLSTRPDESQPTTGYADVRRIALARLLIGNVPSIQVNWQLYGPKLAQVALTFGADDVDAVSPAAGGELGRRRSAREEIMRNIKAAGLEPIERDGRYGVRRL